MVLSRINYLVSSEKKDSKNFTYEIEGKEDKVDKNQFNIN